MIKLTNIAINKCEDSYLYSVYERLITITGITFLSQLKNLDFTPYIPACYLNKISKTNLDTNETKGTIKFYLKDEVIMLDANNFYYADCEECKNLGICNPY